MKTLIIDNYDSFTYNLFQITGELGGNPVVYYNNQIGLDKIKQLNPSHIIISPGPGSAENPEDFGIGRDVILNLGPTIPILGVCLGHQGIIHAYGGKIEQSRKIIHGLTSLIGHGKSKIFKNIPKTFSAMRYHSLCGSAKKFPLELKITAWTIEDKQIMGIEHFKYPTFGIQFHPESFGTPEGKKILSNFLNITC